MQISACYIVKNEEHNLQKSINSLAKVVDEVIVVDTGSQDGTREVARSLGAKVYTQQWQNDFSLARNFALDKAGGEWVVFLDADEYFVNSSGLDDYIKKADTFPSCEALLLPLMNINTDTGTEQAELISREYSLRIWRHRPNVRFYGCVHEMLLVSEGEILRSPKLITAHEKFTLHHTGYSHGLMPKKHKRYLKMLQQDIRERGEQPLSARYLADCYFGLEDYEKAAYYASRAISREKQLGIKTVAGFCNLYCYWLDSGVKLHYSLAKLQKIAAKALEDTKNEEKAILMRQYIDELWKKVEK